MKRGRKPIPKEDQAISTTFSLLPEDRELIAKLSESMNMDKSKIIRYLLRCCAWEANQGLRNQIIALDTNDRYERMANRYKKTKSMDYTISIKWIANVYKGDIDAKTASKITSEAVDQHNKVNTITGGLYTNWKKECEICKKANIQPPTWDEYQEEYR